MSQTLESCIAENQRLYAERDQLTVENRRLRGELSRLGMESDRMRAELTRSVADCGICRLGARTVHINDDCPRHGGDW